MDYETIRKNFESHGFSTQFFSTDEEAKAYLAETVQRTTVGFGSSMTLQELGLYEELEKKNTIAWHMKTPSMYVRRLASHANVYITSVNAVTETGEIVNIDRIGNRIAMTAFGPRNCYYIVGKNKITKNVAEALHRAKHVAGPKNAQRVKSETPCAVLGDKCYDCNVPGRICRMTMITERAPYGMESEVIFIDQDLGL